jgi:Flp pilus assembly protein CpaB
MTPKLRLAFSSLGVATALTAGALGFVLVEDEPTIAVPVAKSDAILIARQPIQAGARITQLDLEWQSIPAQENAPDSILRSRQAVSEIIGSTALRNIVAGETIRKGAVSPPTASKAVAASLNPGWRAVTVTANVAQASGVLRANDRVDLLLGSEGGASPPAGPMGAPLAALQSASGDQPMLPERTFANVRVIAINGSIGADASSKDDEASPSAITSISFEVLPAQVGPIMAAASAGQMIIALRSPLEKQVSSPSPMEAKTRPMNKQSGNRKIPSGRSLNTTKSNINARSTNADMETVTIIRGGGSSRDN